MLKGYSFILDVIPVIYVKELKKEWNEAIIPEDNNDSDYFLMNKLSSLSI